MKSKLLLSALFTFVFYLLSSQVPQGINYQALAGDASGNPIRNTNLQVKISILSDTILPVTVWEELHSTIRTNAHGIFSLVVGSGVRQPASSVSTFSDINWSAKPLFIKTQIYYQSAWKNMGSAKLWTVPYAMVAGNLSGSLKKLGVKGVTSSPDSALFEVKNINGQTVFAVYNEGVRVYVDDGIAKGAKGGFAIGGFDQAKAEGQNYFFINSDSIRMYIDSNPLTKKAKGGFAIGGYDMTKGAVQDYLNVSGDSIRMYINNTPAAKKAKGGFAIGGFDQAKGPVVPFVDLSPKNYFIGHEAGLKNTTGLYNSFLGYQAGKENTQGTSNIFIGYQSGYLNTLGDDNTFVGYQAGFNNIGNDIGGVQQHGDYNCYFGYKAGYSSQMGDYNTMIGFQAGMNNIASLNTFIGYNAGFSNISGGYNTFVGLSAGIVNLVGRSNVFMGHQAGHSNVDGDYNIFIGTTSGAGIRNGSNNVILGTDAVSGTVYSGTGTGSSNVIIGYKAGQYATNGSSNIFIGSQAGYNETGSNLLYIDNSSTSTPLIWGDFSSNSLRINGNLCYTGAFGVCSDARYKKDVQEISNAMELLKNTRGVYYTWKQEEYSGMNFNSSRQIGVIAQEIENCLPELVSTDAFGYKMVDYSKFTPVIIEAMKEQQKQIEGQQKQIESSNQENLQLKSELQLLKDKIEQIEAMLAKGDNM